MAVLFIVVLASCIACDAFGAKLTGVKGKVVDAITGIPVSGAAIEATTVTNREDEQKYKLVKTKTSQDGSFFLKGLPNKNYNLLINKDGYLRGNMFNNYYGNINVSTPDKSNILLDNPIRLYPFPKRYTFSGQTALDSTTGLMWIRKAINVNRNDPSTEELLSPLNEYNRSKFAGYDDWRMPTESEVIDLVSYHAKFISSPNQNSASALKLILTYVGFSLDNSEFVAFVENGKVGEVILNEANQARWTGNLLNANVLFVRNGKR
jgi:hypothetical protein